MQFSRRWSATRQCGNAETEIAELKERFATLTAREREVMGLLVSGMLTKQIASILGTSEITATVHRGKVMRKMRAHSLLNLAEWKRDLSFRNGLGRDIKGGSNPMPHGH
jgi:FixJ family two-component response regulator